MRLFPRSKKSCYCAFCKTPRQVYSKKHANFFNILGCLILAACLSLVIWGALDPRLSVFFVLLMMASELFVYLRWRYSVVCHRCGFDPVIYKTSPEKARDLVKKFYAEKIADPRFLLSRSPILEIYKKNMEAERAHLRIQRVKDLRASRKNPSAALTPSEETETSSLL